MKEGAIVVYESTVYPGVTEDVCGAASAGIDPKVLEIGCSAS